MRLRRNGNAFVVLALLVGACGSGSTSVADRVVSLETTDCGHASRTSGAGVIIEDGWVLVSAHVVIGAGGVQVAGAFGEEPGEIVVLDTVADVALLRVDGAKASPIELASARVGNPVQLLPDRESEPVAASVVEMVEVRIEAVRSTERISRFGFQIDERVELGDSGGGVFDEDGNLVGIVYARPLVGEQRSFVVNSDMISNVLKADRSRTWSCDPSMHRITDGSK